MALYILHSIFHLARLLYVRSETFGPYYVYHAICQSGICRVFGVEYGNLEQIFLLVLLPFSVSGIPPIFRIHSSIDRGQHERPTDHPNKKRLCLTQTEI